MAKYVITREFGAVYLTDNLLSPPQHQKQLFKVGQIIDARKPTQQEIDTYKVSDATNLISSDNWIIYTNAVQTAPASANQPQKPQTLASSSTPLLTTVPFAFAGAGALIAYNKKFGFGGFILCIAGAFVVGLGAKNMFKYGNLIGWH